MPYIHASAVKPKDTELGGCAAILILTGCFGALLAIASFLALTVALWKWVLAL